MKAKDIMTKKIVTVSPDYTLRKLIKVLEDNQITGVPVVDKKGKLAGIVSGRDIIRAARTLIKVHLSVEEINEHKGKLNWVEGIMTKRVVTVTEDTDILEVFKLMTKKQIHRVPVMRKNKLVGIISTSDAYKALSKIIK